MSQVLCFLSRDKLLVEEKEIIPSREEEAEEEIIPSWMWIAYDLSTTEGLVDVWR